jgi:outer membrane protein
LPAAAEVKIGVVDIAKLFAESPQAKVVQEGLRAEFQPRLQQLVAQEQALKTRNDKYQKDLATMAADQRTKAEKDLRDSAREIERKKAELQDDSNAKRQEEMNKAATPAVREVSDYAKAQGYDVVIAEGVLTRLRPSTITAAVLNVHQDEACRRGGSHLPRLRSHPRSLKSTVFPRAFAGRVPMTLGERGGPFRVWSCAVTRPRSWTPSRLWSQAGRDLITFLARSQYGRATGRHSRRRLILDGEGGRFIIRYPS